MLVAIIGLLEKQKRGEKTQTNFHSPAAILETVTAVIIIVQRLAEIFIKKIFSQKNEKLILGD